MSSHASQKERVMSGVAPAVTRKVSVSTLEALRARGAAAVFLTAYDYPTAVFADRAGVDMLLVGDSAAMTMLGHASTTSITMDEMLVFARAVCRGAQRAFVIGDLPFLSYQVSDALAIQNAGAFIAAGCDAVKCEGGARVGARVRAMTDAGIAVMGHIGLTPQSLGQLGGYRVQGKTLAAVQQLADDARALQDAGAFAVLLEAVPAEAAAYIRDSVDILVYGIGAGPHVDGQLVISHDLLGNFVGDIQPRFVRRYAHLDQTVEAAFRAYGDDVRARRFPGAEHCYPIDPVQEEQIRNARLTRLETRPVVVDLHASELTLPVRAGGL
jgi:3-methyl-2-oxobutanoate hydroxymethyltransferase